MGYYIVTLNSLKGVTMDNLIDKNIVNSVDALDLIGGSIAKPLIEKGVSNFVGNGNFVSGGIKLITAIGVAKYGGNNRIAKSIAIGAGMDGAEDIIIASGVKMGISPTDDVDGGLF
jgi:hypothetical protein